MRPLDAETKLLGQYPRLAAMVDMAVGDQDFLQFHASLRHRILQLMQIAPRINQRALVGLGAPEKRTILLQRRDRNDRCLQRR